MPRGLIIDDNRQTAEALKTLLSELGLGAAIATGSSDAIVQLLQASPDFICLDINMPGLDGNQILAYLRREQRFSKVPVIVISSDDQPQTRLEILRAGAQAMLVKPATLDALEGALRTAGIHS